MDDLCMHMEIQMTGGGADPHITGALGERIEGRGFHEMKTLIN